MSEGGICGRCGSTASWLDISGVRQCLNCNPPAAPGAVATRKSNTAWILIGVGAGVALAIFAVAMVLKNKDALSTGESKRDLTKVRVHKIANEYYARWSIKNADKACPSTLLEVGRALDSTMKPDELQDLWGRDMKFMCGDKLPAGAKGLAVYSFGEDGRDDEGRFDDIKSW